MESSHYFDNNFEVRHTRMIVKAKDLRTGMIVEIEMKATEYARKNTVIKWVEIEEDVLYEDDGKDVLVEFVDCETDKGGVILINPEQELKLIDR